MKSLGLLVFLCLALPFAAPAADRDIVELKRDVALLQDQLRTLQSRVDEKMAGLTVLVQQALDGINKTNTSVTMLDANVRDRMKEQATNLVAPVASIGSKVDQMAGEFQGVKETIADMSARLGKVQQQIVDLSNTVKVIQSPAPPPPGASPAAGGSLPPGVSAESLYANAMRDKDGGNYDLALEGFTNYLRFFGGTEMAPNAQFYVGDILYRKGNLENALQAFDLVLEKYPQNNKTADAMYMKGQTLLKMNERTKAAAQFRELIGAFPNSELAARARAQIKSLGLSVSAPATRKRKR